MIIYKIVRYFTFIILVSGSVLFYFNDSLRPIPSVAEFFDRIKEGSKTQVTDTDPTEIFSEMEFHSTHLFDNIRVSVDDLTNDFRFPTVIRCVLSGSQYDDVAFLMDEYFGNNTHFRDFILKNNDNIVYKYKSTDSDIVMSFRVDLSMHQNGLYLELVFDNVILNTILDRLPKNYLLKYNNQIYAHSNPEQDLTKCLSKDINYIREDKVSWTNLENIIYKLNSDSSQNVSHTLYSISPLERGFSFRTLLIYLLIPLVWFLFLILDFFVKKNVIQKTRVEVYKKTYSKFDTAKDTEHSIDETLSWLDRFIKVEILSELNQQEKPQETDLLTKSDKSDKSDTDNKE